jgi:hypothetical protein
LARNKPLAKLSLDGQKDPWKGLEEKLGIRVISTTERRSFS